jgi:glycosyltransferase involved in cell wall biosynthesis
VTSGPEAASLSICVVGSGPRFLSGISYYTNRLVNALAGRHPVSAILMRQLLPTRLYPGRARVGAPLTRFRYPPGTEVFDGVNWWWGRSLLRAIGLLRRRRPDVVVLQWWTGTVLHTYLVLALVARLLGSRVVMEFHEVQDTGELQIAPARWYVRALAPLLVRMCDGYVVHNEFDREALEATYGLGDRPVAMVPHGPYDQYVAEPKPAEDGVCRLLYFGVIRPFKGVEDLLEAFAALSAEQAARFTLTVVGETWEGWTLPARLIADHPHRDRIRFVNRYVSDDEVAEAFAAADAVVLPYHRSSSSGPLHLAMANGLPVVVSAVGGLVQASEGYGGALRVPPRDPAALRGALDRAWELRGRRFADVHSWERTVERYDELLGSLCGAGR